MTQEIQDKYIKKLNTTYAWMLSVIFFASTDALFRIMDFSRSSSPYYAFVGVFLVGGGMISIVSDKEFAPLVTTDVKRKLIFFARLFIIPPLAVLAYEFGLASKNILSENEYNGIVPNLVYIGLCLVSAPSVKGIINKAKAGMGTPDILPEEIQQARKSLLFSYLIAPAAITMWYALCIFFVLERFDSPKTGIALGVILAIMVLVLVVAALIDNRQLSESLMKIRMQRQSKRLNRISTVSNAVLCIVALICLVLAYCAVKTGYADKRIITAAVVLYLLSLIWSAVTGHRAVKELDSLEF